MPKNLWTAFEHKLNHEFKKTGLNLKLKGKTFLLACSGGSDSLAVLYFLYRMQKAYDIEIQVLHVHHGKTDNKKYRDQAAQFVEKKCKELNLPFHLYNGAVKAGASEQDLRLLRRKAYREISQKIQSDYIVTGHHLDDLLETRMMRLIRGAGRNGLKAMQILESGDWPFFRPFLRVRRTEIIQYLKQINVDWLEDPSNRDMKPLRNWVRNKWLFALEQRDPQFVENLARSLERIIKDEKEAEVLYDFSEGISRIEYSLMKSNSQRHILISYLNKIGISDLKYTQIEEIRKYLDKSQKVNTFNVARAIWNVNAERIIATKIL